MKHIGNARLGRDAELKKTGDGTAYANLSLAVDYRDGQNRETQWISATLWGKQAESLAQYLLKGTVHCFCLSDLHAKEGKDGKTYINARCDSVELGPKGQGAAAAQKPSAHGGVDDDGDLDTPF
jgi:single-strand DNA-binding protein